MTPPRPLATAAWGLFLASSWTWCIGLFLPFVLLGRHGWIAYAAFLLFNVLGCAAMGYVIRTPERSRAFLQRHRHAVFLFSAATVAYHLFFVGFVARHYLPGLGGLDDPLGGPLATSFLVPLGFLAVAALLALAPERIWPLAGSVVYGVSLAAFAAVLAKGPEPAPVAENVQSIDLLVLVPLVACGFLLCPYLDGTFHLALQRAPSRHAFGVFGVTFLLMIVLSLFLWNDPPLAPLLLAHVLAQIVFTTAIHTRTAWRLRPPRSFWTPAAAVLLLALAVPALLVAARADEPSLAGVADYLRYLVLYGLAFPAYVFLFALPWRPLPTTPRAFIIFAFLLALALPFYEVGFVGGVLPLLALPAVLLLAVKLTFGGTPRLD